MGTSRCRKCLNDSRSYFNRSFALHQNVIGSAETSRDIILCPLILRHREQLLGLVCLDQFS